MKRILLIIAIVLCVGVAATALGFEFNGAEPKTGTLTADSMIALTLESSASSLVVLTPGVIKVYPLYCGFERSAHAPSDASGELTVTLADSASYSMDKISVTVYSDAECNSPIAGKSRTGAGVITLSDISSDTTFYIGLFVPNDMSDTSGIGGTIKFAFTHTA